MLLEGFICPKFMVWSSSSGCRVITFTQTELILFHCIFLFKDSLFIQLRAYRANNFYRQQLPELIAYKLIAQRDPDLTALTHFQNCRNQEVARVEPRTNPSPKMSSLSTRQCCFFVFRVVTTEGSPTGRPCPYNLAETKPCPAIPCYKFVRTSWTCDLQVSPIQTLDLACRRSYKNILEKNWTLCLTSTNQLSHVTNFGLSDWSNAAQSQIILQNF